MLHTDSGNCQATSPLLQDYQQLLLHQVNYLFADDHNHWFQLNYRFIHFQEQTSTTLVAFQGDTFLAVGFSRIALRALFS